MLSAPRRVGAPKSRAPGLQAREVVSAIGIVSNLVSFLVMLRHRTFKSSFGLLGTCYALTNAFILIIFAVWAAPWTIW
ncbi:hypothetical protein COOONC_25151 [Cooperia oncophora]